MGVVTRDVKSIAKSGSTKLKGDVTLSEGSGVAITQSGQDIEIAASGGSAVWGSITGTLSDQSDLQAALDAKVDLAGDTMTGNLTVDKATGFTTLQLESDTTTGYMYAYDGDDSVNIGSNSDSVVNIKKNNTTVAVFGTSADVGLKVQNPSSSPRTIQEITAPDGNAEEATLATILDYGSGNREWVDWTIEDYAGADHKASINVVKSGTGTIVPFVIRTWDADLGTVADEGIEHLTITPETEVIINDQSNDIDFRVEGDTDANLLVTDASTDRVGIGTNTPGQKFHVAGNMQLENELFISFSTPRISLFNASDRTLSIANSGGGAANLSVQDDVSVGGALTVSDEGIEHLTITPETEVIINDQSNDIDFRVEGDTDANLLVTDASTDRVGIGTNTPGQKFHVAGNMQLENELFISFSTPRISLFNASDRTLSIANSGGGAANLSVQDDVSVGGALTVSDEAYGAGWNGNNEVPTKNAVYDKIETLSTGGLAPLAWKHRAGRYYGGLSTGISLGNVTPAQDTLWAIPILIPEDNTYDTIAISLEGTSGSSVVRLGIYDDDGDLYPDNLIVDAGETSTATGEGLGMKTKTISEALTAGLYWLVYLAGSGTPVVRGFSSRGLLPILGGSNIAPATTNGCAWTVSYSYAALPATFPGSASVDTSAGIPFVGIKH